MRSRAGLSPWRIHSPLKSRVGIGRSLRRQCEADGNGFGGRRPWQSILNQARLTGESGQKGLRPLPGQALWPVCPSSVAFDLANTGLHPSIGADLIQQSLRAVFLHRLSVRFDRTGLSFHDLNVALARCGDRALLDESGLDDCRHPVALVDQGGQFGQQRRAFSVRCTCNSCLQRMVAFIHAHERPGIGPLLLQALSHM